MSLPRQLLENIQSISGISGSNFGIQSDSLSLNEENIRKDIEYTIKIKGPNGQLNQNYLPEPNKSQLPGDFESKQLTSKVPYVGQATGYDNNRQLYSQEQIREAFKIIDINKDGALTIDDLSFFLDCMGEEYTLEEVKEMIKIVSTDGEKVVIDDFKKIGKGKIVPFAGIKAPDQNTKSKAAVLQNLKLANLSIFDPHELSQHQQAFQINYDKFQLQKAMKNEINQEYLQEDIKEEELVLKLRTFAEIKSKKAQFSRIAMLNIQKIIQNYKNCKSEFIQGREIAQMLSISQNQARQLFLQTSKKISAKSVVLDAILFCPKLPIKRLQLILLHMNRNQLVQFDEWLQVLVFMIGSDHRKTIYKKLIQTLKDKKIDITREYDKYFILQIMDQSLKLSHFVW